MATLLADLRAETDRTIEVTVTAFPATTIEGTTHP